MMSEWCQRYNQVEIAIRKFFEATRLPVIKRQAFLLKYSIDKRITFAPLHTCRSYINIGWQGLSCK